MKKMLFPLVAAGLLVFLTMVQGFSQEDGKNQEVKPIYVTIPIKITVDQATVVPAFEGGEPPTFTVETFPEYPVSIMVATDFDLMITEKGQSIEKVFVSIFGSEAAGIPPVVLKSDTDGYLTYTLPTPVFEAMSEGPSRIYYIAEVIGPNRDEHYDLLGVSFDYQAGKEVDAPRIAIEQSPRIAQSQEHFKTAQAHFAKKEYAAAAKEFNEALVLWPNPAFEYNIGICHLRLGLEYLSAAVAGGRFSAGQNAAIKEFISLVEDNIFMVEK